MRNYERIKAMSVEEMAEFLREIYQEGYINGYHFSRGHILENDETVKQWLESEV